MSTHSDKSWIIGRVTMSADMPRQQTCQTSRQVLDNWTCNNVPRLLQTVDLSTHLDKSRVHGHVTMTTDMSGQDRQTDILTVYDILFCIQYPAGWLHSGQHLPSLRTGVSP